MFVSVPSSATFKVETVPSDLMHSAEAYATGFVGCFKMKALHIEMKSLVRLKGSVASTGCGVAGAKGPEEDRGGG